jgi:pimeloyl-ACP methyl ester carboxylesterase
MKLRLYHHRDGARIAYREAGVGPPLALVHSAGLSHREFEPLVEELSDRFRLVLPDLPLHGDSEDRPNHPYTQEWLVEVLAGFIRDTCGPRPIVGGHDVGALLVLRAVLSQQIQPERLVLLPSALHHAPPNGRSSRLVRVAARAGGIPGFGSIAARGATLAFRPAAGEALSARGNPAARDLVRHALQGLPRNGNRAKAWAKAARRWPAGPDADLLDGYRHITCPTLLLWADADRRHPLALAEELEDLIPGAQLRTLDGTGYLMAYDDPVGMAREIAAFCL